MKLRDWYICGALALTFGIGYAVDKLFPDPWFLSTIHYSRTNRVIDKDIKLGLTVSNSRLHYLPPFSFEGDDIENSDKHLKPQKARPGLDSNRPATRIVAGLVAIILLAESLSGVSNDKHS